ncbi:uncharacterized protein Z518_08851 [Rhinocladiella mackenziei CBS 650.93]|uniref:Glyoxalase/fosfomycin resistance/dioxygenase domain-containing protein n=1 Tax=Rhinocladiella mackenziei CBS 650.93 TaxID=1442369 RepID=A0A0D2GXL0_9EURO|nr:uncharacterized protein Z518_08851 [Rhinocladiella mackenziei CBS 650.93]KIX02908.1 hypothetical protein Z518_08851 [Rhinocladiella mackenziei CBS 650.93]
MSGQYTQTIFLNLPVLDLSASIAFYTSLGFVQNKTFSDDRAAMVSIPQDFDADPKAAHVSPIKVMLLTEPRFKEFLPDDRKIADTKANTEVLICLSMKSREMLDEFVGKAEKGGAKVDIRKPQEYGWMYGRSFADLDGHIWEAVWMDPKEYEGKE